MTWEVLNGIGTVAFAASGAIVAMEEEYDIFGVFVLGLLTAFGGGVVRNVLLDLPVTALMEDFSLIGLALLTIGLIYAFPPVWQRFGTSWTFFDAVGLAAFSLQGAMVANGEGMPSTAVLIAAVLTGTGGGVLRDVLAGRKPLVFRREIYAGWALLGGGLMLWSVPDAVTVFGFMPLLVTLRMLSVKYRWELPRRTL